MFGILLAVHVLVTIFLILIILIQKSEGGSSLFASGSGNSMFSARGTSNMLTKTTWVLAAIFLLNCILMAHIAAVNIKNTNTIISGKSTVKRQAKPDAPLPVDAQGKTKYKQPEQTKKTPKKSIKANSNKSKSTKQNNTSDDKSKKK